MSVAPLFSHFMIAGQLLKVMNGTSTVNNEAAWLKL
jgi:hypothetical protein